MMDVTGVAFVLAFYACIIACGVWIAKKKNALHPSTAEDLMLAGKSLGLAVGICTLVATEVGGAFVNGTAEEVFRRGALWCLAPVGYSLSMTINGLFFVHKLRRKNYVTLVDALQHAYGQTVGGLVYLPSCVGDVCWTAAVLSSLGVSLQVVLGVDRVWTVSVSALVAVCYTLLGGMHAVAYTDVVQLVFIGLGLFLAIPFVLLSPNVALSGAELADWTGRVTSSGAVVYADTLLLVVCGGIPWQPYYQRAMSVKTDLQVKVLSVAATVLCLVCMVPSVVFGVAAKRIDWANSSLPEVLEDSSMVLPAVIYQETPRWITLLCLASISAAVMSSVDSALLSGASYLTRNLYQQVLCSIGNNEPPTELNKSSIMVLRACIVGLGVVSVLLSLSTSTIYGLWVLAGDLGFVVVFPQFLAAVHFANHVNFAGSIAASLVATVLRVLVGEETFGWRPWYKVPSFADGSQMIPVKSIIMLVGLFTLLLVSKIYTTVSRIYLKNRHEL